MLSTMLIGVIVLALVFDYINGFHDTANAIATSVSTRALSPSTAVYLSAVLNFSGALISTGVAKTIGGEIVMSSNIVTQEMLIFALLGAILWNLLTWWFGIPSSSSHALIGGLVGVVYVARGVDALNVYGIMRIFGALVLSALVALVLGFIIMNILRWVVADMNPSKLNSRFKKLQIISAAAMSFAHGSNDAQKSMGIMTLALVSAGILPSFEVPFWVKLSAATAMSLGTAVGGWRIIKTMGGKIFKLEPSSGFAADLNSSLVILGATLLHLPVSTTHVVSGSIMGVGSAKRIRAVRWGVAKQMVFTWVLTIPSTALVTSLLYKLVISI